MINGLIYSPVTVPDTWDELPLSHSHRAALKLAIYELPLFLRLATATMARPQNNRTAIDDEVAEFTHKDGWRKLDKVLPLVRHITEFSWLLACWSQCLLPLLTNLPIHKDTTSNHLTSQGYALHMSLFCTSLS